MDFFSLLCSMSIKIETFKAGHLEKSIGYQYFVPENINVQWAWSDNALNELLEKASIKLGELNSYALLVPNIELFIQLHVTKEAVLSSRIEGTQTNINEALMPREEISAIRRSDWQEVNNYSKAMNKAIEKLNELPLSSRLLREAHAIILDHVRGEDKLPGHFRTSQNWIGGASLADARFIPPIHSLVNPLMGDLENFLHNKDLHIPTLIKAAIAHYQFETIHPFLDGNGRVGRLLITLFLVNEKILNKPLLYLSAFFEKNKSLYYDNLTRVREKNDLLQWLKYFLIGVEQTASQSVETLGKVLELKQQVENEMHSKLGRRSAKGFLLLNALFIHPVMSVSVIEKKCGLSKKSANELAVAFEKQGWLKEVTGQTRNRVFVFEPYLNLFE
jgi:Fic family protein